MNGAESVAPGAVLLADPRLKTFALVWVSQLLSAFGSGLTGFALGVMVYQQTGSVTTFSLLGMSTVLPGILFSPLAGALVDRWDQRWSLIVSDVGAGLCTLVIVTLLAFGVRAIWPLCLLLAVSSLFASLQWPAYSAAVTVLIPKRHFDRASGMVQLGIAASQILAPLTAGALIAGVGVSSILWLDLSSCAVAVAVLLAVRIPGGGEGALPAPRSSLLREAAAGWSYIRCRSGLLALLAFLGVINLAAGFSQALVPPMVLSFGTEAELGIVLAAASAGLLGGSLVMSLFGGPRNRARGVLTFGLFYGLCYCALGLRPSAWPTAAAFGALLFMVPLINGCSQAIWQAKVPLELQGRVFAVRRMIAQASQPLALLLAGPLADGLFTGMLASGGPLAGSAGRLIGTGPGRGIGLLLFLIGLLVVSSALGGRTSSRLRRVELEIPDAVRD